MFDFRKMLRSRTEKTKRRESGIQKQVNSRVSQKEVAVEIVNLRNQLREDCATIIKELGTMRDFINHTYWKLDQISSALRQGQNGPIPEVKDEIQT